MSVQSALHILIPQRKEKATNFNHMEKPHDAPSLHRFESHKSSRLIWLFASIPSAVGSLIVFFSSLRQNQSRDHFEPADLLRTDPFTRANLVMLAVKQPAESMGNEMPLKKKKKKQMRK